MMQSHHVSQYVEGHLTTHLLVLSVRTGCFLSDHKWRVQFKILKWHFSKCLPFLMSCVSICQSPMIQRSGEMYNELTSMPQTNCLAHYICSIILGMVWTSSSENLIYSEIACFFSTCEVTCRFSPRALFPSSYTCTQTQACTNMLWMSIKFNVASPTYPGPRL